MIPFIDIHTHAKAPYLGIAFYNLIPEDDSLAFEHCTFGVHPWDMGKNEVELYINKLQKLLQEKAITAVGEIGIDRTIDFPLDSQQELFRKQHKLAEQYNLPVIIHCVKAWSDLLSLRKMIGNGLPWIFHGYNGNLITATQLINCNCYLSFGYSILKNEKVQQVLTQVPLNRIFLETDNSGEKIETIYKKAADLLHICIDDLKSTIFENYKTIFT